MDTTLQLCEHAGLTGLAVHVPAVLSCDLKAGTGAFRTVETTRLPSSRSIYTRT